MSVRSRWLRFARLIVASLLVAGLAALTGCATALPEVQRAPSKTLVAAADSPLVHVAADSGVPEGKSGFWPMPEANHALDARLALIRNARSSLDLQYYLVGNDNVGQRILRELRDAANRGVRVRLLVDDLYTQGLDPLLLGLQATPNVEIRLFNPFVSGRSTSVGRFFGLLADFRRLNHRMHNKLFIADGAMAVVGGRNLADEYFLRARDVNFLDMDLLVTGALVPRLGELFDEYWNSEQAYPLHAIVTSLEPAEALQRDFEERTANVTVAPIPPLFTADAYGEPPFSRSLGGGRQRFVVADAGARADLPTKVNTGNGAQPLDFSQTVTFGFIQFVQQAKSEVLIFSPYFIPGDKGMERLRAARDAGIEVRIVTNALATSDEPLVNVSYERYRDQMLHMGVKLYELSAARLDRDPTIKRALGSSSGRLHAKMAFVDRKTVLVGSMNLDLRSAYLNTEIGIAVQSPELAEMILRAYRADNLVGVYQVKLKDDGSGVSWVGHDENGDDVQTEEPEVGLWQRFRLWLMFLFIPEDLL